MNTQARNDTGPQSTGTYTQSDWMRMTEGWHVVTMPNAVALLDVDANAEQDELFGPRVFVLRPMCEEALLQDAFKQLENYQMASDVPHPDDMGKRTGRFLK